MQHLYTYERCVSVTVSNTNKLYSSKMQLEFLDQENISYNNCIISTVVVY